MRVWDRHVKSPDAARRLRYTPAARHKVPCLPNAPSEMLCGIKAQDARLMRARSNMRSRVALPGGAGMLSLLHIELSACSAAQSCADMLERCGVSSLPLSATCLPIKPYAMRGGIKAWDARLMRVRSNMRSRAALPGGAGMLSLLRI